MKSKYSQNLLIGFGLSLLILLVSSAASFISIQNLLSGMQSVNHTYMILQDLESVISLLKDAETGQRGYLLTGDVEFLEDYNGARENVMGLITSLHEQTQDNPSQQENSMALKELADRRLDLLQQYIDLKKSEQPIEVLDLKEGKAIMDQTRALIDKMEEEENNLLAVRNANVDRSATFTPLLIILAFILAILITIYFYIRLKRDFEERAKLQQELEQKELETYNRIRIIQNIAEKISEGDYKTRVNNEEKDGLGGLAFSLNKMASSLESAFNILSDNEWLQKGIAGTNDTMVGEKNLEILLNDTIAYIAEFTESQVGAFYLLDGKDDLKLAGSYALKNDPNRKRIKVGEGLVGQAALSKKEIFVTEVPAENVGITYASGEALPTSLAIFPVFHERKLKGVIEIASVEKYTKNDLQFVKEVCPNIGASIQSAQNHKRLQELLEETQAQSEELQAQHSELENLNAELEAQTQKLQASEEELKVQQKELIQANQDLEERTKLLEEKNQIIVERTLEIQKKAEELALSTKYKSEFLANMSHELRTPLNSILLLSRLLTENNEKNLTKEQIEYAEVIQSAGNGLLTLIDEILDLSKIEAGKMNLEFADVRMEEIAEDMRVLFLPLAKEKKLNFEINIADTPEHIHTDKTRLEQILKNLLSNALKFTSRGYVNLEIFPAEKSGFISFSVKDSGIGIPAEKQKLIFEAFQQADGSTRRKFGGTGLGLSISRELARLLGGEIQLESKSGKGSNFTITLPVSKLQEVSEMPVSAAEELSSLVEENEIKEKDERAPLLATVIPEEIPDDRNTITPEDKVVLIVEDDTNFAASLLKFSKKSGYKGIVTVRGDQVMALALQYKPVAILLDIVLPVKDGWQVMEELKADPATRHIPVHVMSSLEVKRESLVKGAIDFINKPFALDQIPQIFSKLEEALNRDKKKVVIVEENTKHAKALSYFLENFNVHSEIANDVKDGASLLKKNEVDCIILDMGLPDQNAYEILELVKKNPEMENLPIIIFTGKSLSKAEETRIRQYADSIVVKTAHSYQRILDEVGLFLHLVEEQKQHAQKRSEKNGKMGNFNEVLKDKKVLIADDDVRNIFSITKALERYKMNVISAIDGKEALQQLEAHPDVNVVLMDMMMPELDGYETTSRIRQDPRFRNLPILAVTAKAMMGDREKCIRAGASDYISKPIDIDQLTSLLRVWLYDQA